MNHFIKKGDIVFDIGAEEGDFPALFALWGARPVLFEPNPKVWPNIKAIFEANELRIASAFVGFAGDETNDLGWKYDHSQDWPECANGKVIGDHGFMNLLERPDVPSIRIDDFPFIPDVITIDTEGSELRVLRGAEKTLDADRPIVFVSVHREFMKDMYPGDTPEKLVRFMEELGYHKVYLGSDHEDHLLFHPERSYQ